MTTKKTPEPEGTTRLTITWSKQADFALRSYLSAQGMKKGDISKFIEEAVRWRIFHDTVQEARAAFAEQIKGLVDAGADVILMETFSDLMEMLEALASAFDSFQTSGRCGAESGDGL